MLGAKERALLLALSETEYCTSGTLAKALGVSSKTAQGMVKDLREKLQKNGADILARTRHGYLLQVNDRALFETLSSGENAAAHFIPSGSEERIHYLLVLLLGQVDYVKLDDVSEELYVSKYTISGDLHQVEEELAKYHLSILRRPNYGIRITGREIDIRNCTAHVLANYNNMMPDGGAGYRNMAQRISQCLMRAMHKHALHFSEINFRNLVNTILQPFTAHYSTHLFHCWKRTAHRTSTRMCMLPPTIWLSCWKHSSIFVFRSRRCCFWP